MTSFLHTAPLAGREDGVPPEEASYCPRDHARRLGMTEADLIEMDEGHASARLRPDWTGLLAALRTLGPTIAQTCSANAVLQVDGMYPRLMGDTADARFAGDKFDLQLRLTRWAHAWAVKQAGETSLQVFGQDGSAIHKVYLTRASNRAGWMQLLDAYAAPGLPPQDSKPPAASDPFVLENWLGVCARRDGFDIGIDVQPLPDRFAAARGQGWFRSEPERAWQVAAGSLRTVLTAVVEARLPIEMTVGNPGCVHTCKGLVATLEVRPSWLVVSGSRFNLRVLEGAIAEVWLVTRGTKYGVVSGLEMFDRSGSAVAALSGRRGADMAEDRRWRAILDTLPPHLPCGPPRASSLESV